MVFAIPAFVAFMALEMASLRVREDQDDDADSKRFVGYEARDTRTSILMGAGSLVVSGSARIGALIGYAALYELTPLRLDSHRWYTWVFALLVVDLLWYSYHRASHRVRLMWAAHQAHHNSQRFNHSTAVRQKWNPWFELLFWTPLPLLGLPPWMIFTSFSVNLIFQFLVHTEKVDRLPGPSNSCSTPRRTTGCITPATRTISTRTTPASSSSGIGCSVPTPRRRTGRPTG